MAWKERAKSQVAWEYMHIREAQEHGVPILSMLQKELAVLVVHSRERSGDSLNEDGVRGVHY